MARSFDRLEAGMSPNARREARQKAASMLSEMALHELRAARNLSQEELGRKLGVKQAAVSKMEKRTDMYLSTLRNYISAMGGTLEIVARFPDGTVEINQFAEIGGPLDAAS